MKMKLNKDAFRLLELFGWFVASLVTIFCFGHFFVFIAFAVGVRHLYMRFKNARLGMLPTEDKSVLITGCDSGFGLALAKRLHDKGFDVFATCLNLSSDGAKSLQNIKSERMKVLQLDVTDDGMIAKILEVVKAECNHTGLWGLVNNSGMNFMGEAETMTMPQYQRCCDINLFGMIRMCKAFLPLVRQAKGRILNVTSVKAVLPVHGADAYTVAKFGAQAFSVLLRQEMKLSGVKVITIEPGKYGGVTAVLNEASMVRLGKQVDAMWDEASPEVRQFYGETHFKAMLDVAKDSIASSHPTVNPIIDAEEEALRSHCPRSSYLIGGSNTFIDKTTLFARLHPILPETIYERLREYFFPYTIRN